MSALNETPVSSQEAEPQQGIVSVDSAVLNDTTTSGTVASEINASTLGGVTNTEPTRQEAIAARTAKRKARKVGVREKAEDHKRTGDYLVESNKTKAALPHYQEAIKLWHTNLPYHLALATAYRKLQWYEEAAHSATVALTLNPKSSEARYLRGVARMEQRLLKPAKADFEIVLEHQPGHILARAALSQVTRFIESIEADSQDTAAHLTVLDFSFPPYDHENLELASASDSSDCNHVGNGVPCRFYNHEGCGRGTECTYSHAPDERSVRDLLGKNVCIYHILDSCKFGLGKCVYSHRKESLPAEGWWREPSRIAKVKAVLDTAEKQAKSLRQLESERLRQQYRNIQTNRPPRAAGQNKKNPIKKDKSAVVDGQSPEASGDDQKKEDAKVGDSAKDKSAKKVDEAQKLGAATKEVHEKKDQQKKNSNGHIGYLATKRGGYQNSKPHWTYPKQESIRIDGPVLPIFHRHDDSPTDATYPDRV